MGTILYDEELENFKKVHNLDCVSIIVKIDGKKAYYIIDGEKKVKGNYEELIKYFNDEMLANYC